MTARRDAAGRASTPWGGGIFALGLALTCSLAAACSPGEPTPPPSAVPRASPDRPSASPAPGAPSPGTPSPVVVPATPQTGASDAPSTPAAAASVALDESLLAILPPDVGGVSVTAEPDAFTEAMNDPAFAANVRAAVFPVAVAEGDLVSGVVARLRSGVWSEAFFRDWRDTYDEGACGQAGGVVGNAEAELGGRPVHITSCAGGLLVYHAWLAERDVIVSLLSAGEQRFGEQLIGDLRP